MPHVSIRLPTALEALAGGRSSVDVEAATVRDALRALETRHPAIRPLLRGPDDRVRPHVHLFLDERQVTGDPSVEESIPSDAELRIVPSIAGG